MGCQVSTYFTESLIHLENLKLVLKFSLSNMAAREMRGRGANRFCLRNAHVISLIKVSGYHFLKLITSGFGKSASRADFKLNKTGTNSG